MVNGLARTVILFFPETMRSPTGIDAEGPVEPPFAGRGLDLPVR